MTIKRTATSLVLFLGAELSAQSSLSKLTNVFKGGQGTEKAAPAVVRRLTSPELVPASININEYQIAKAHLEKAGASPGAVKAMAVVFVDTAEYLGVSVSSLLVRTTDKTIGLLQSRVFDYLNQLTGTTSQLGKVVEIKNDRSFISRRLRPNEISTPPDIITIDGGPIDISVEMGEIEVLQPVLFVSAGQTQNITCNLTVTLQGQVTLAVGDMSFHAIEWEQLEGTPVTLFDANTLNPWFDNPGLSDFVFRLWVDKGTVIERFADVSIFRIASSEANNLVSATVVPDVDEVLEAGRTASESLLVVDAYVSPSAFEDQNGAPRAPTAPCEEVFMLYWSAPEDAVSEFTEWLGTEVQVWDTNINDWAFEAFRPAGLNYYLLENNESYRLATVWNDRLRGVVSKVTSNQIYRSWAGRPENAHAGLVSPAGNLISTTAEGLDSVVIRVTTTTESFSDPVNNLISASSYEIFDSVLRLGAITESFDSSVTNSISATSGVPFEDTVITRLNGASIGS